MHRTRIVAAAAGVALMAGLTACGGGGSGSGGGGGEADAVTAALERASESTGEQGSAKVRGSQTQPMPQGEIVSETEGAIDWSDGSTTGEMELTTQGGGQGQAGAGKATKVRYTEDAMYSETGDSAKALGPDAKPWMKIDYDKLAEQSGAQGALVKDQAQNNNPTRSIDMLLAGGDVKKVGTETVNGEKAVQYSGTVKISDMTRMQSENLSKKDQDALVEQMKKQGYRSQTLDVWINEDDLLVKREEQAKSKAGTMTSSVTYSDYGTEVSVEVPPADQTMDFEDALGGIAKQ